MNPTFIRTVAGPRFLAYYEGQFYWVQMTLTGRKPTGFAVLASHGELVSHVVAREIKRLDPTLEGKRIVDTHLRDKLFLTMLDMIPRNVEALAKEAREPLADVREVIQDLVRENVVVAESGGQPRWKNDRYGFRVDLATPRFVEMVRKNAHLAFEARFRGSRDEIRSRLRDYLPHFSGLAPVADLSGTPGRHRGRPSPGKSRRIEPG